jgi:hypothetical protein
VVKKNALPSFSKQPLRALIYTDKPQAIIHLH